MDANILFLSSTLPVSCLDSIQSDLEKDLDQIKVAFITTASKLEKEEGSNDLPDWVNTIKEDAERYFGNVDAIDFTEPSFDLNKLKTDYDILYLNGGNIFYLEKAIREHDFAEAINFFIENKLFIGESAGAAILGIDIYPLRHLDDIDAVENASKKGLEIVKFNILPHYDNNELAEQIKLAEKDFLSSSADLLTINEKQGVITDGEEIIGYE